jgi:hypothetical protein
MRVRMRMLRMSRLGVRMTVRMGSMMKMMCPGWGWGRG